MFYWPSTGLDNMFFAPGQGMWRAYRYLREKTLKNKGLAINENYNNWMYLVKVIKNLINHVLGKYVSQFHVEL